MTSNKGQVNQVNSISCIVCFSESSSEEDARENFKRLPACMHSVCGTCFSGIVKKRGDDHSFLCSECFELSIFDSVYSWCLSCSKQGNENCKILEHPVIHMGGKAEEDCVQIQQSVNHLLTTKTFVVKKRQENESLLDSLARATDRVSREVHRLQAFNKDRLVEAQTFLEGWQQLSSAERTLDSFEAKVKIHQHKSDFDLDEVERFMATLDVQRDIFQGAYGKTLVADGQLDSDLLSLMSFLSILMPKGKDAVGLAASQSNGYVKAKELNCPTVDAPKISFPSEKAARGSPPSVATPPDVAQFVAWDSSLIRMSFTRFELIASCALASPVLFLNKKSALDKSWSNFVVRRLLSKDEFYVYSMLLDPGRNLFTLTLRLVPPATGELQDIPVATADEKKADRLTSTQLLDTLFSNGRFNRRLNDAYLCVIVRQSTPPAFDGTGFLGRVVDGGEHVLMQTLNLPVATDRRFVRVTLGVKSTS